MTKFYLSRAYLTYLGFLSTGFGATLLFTGICSSNFNTAIKDLIPIYVVAAMSPLALRRIEADQANKEKMDLFLITVKLNEDQRFLEECLEKHFEGSGNELS